MLLLAIFTILTLAKYDGRALSCGGPSISLFIGRLGTKACGAGGSGKVIRIPRFARGSVPRLLGCTRSVDIVPSFPSMCGDGDNGVHLNRYVL